jgi:hypothetical protein
MDSLLREGWDKIRASILRRWGHKVSEDQLKEPMSYDDLCTFFSEHCDLKIKKAKAEIDHMLNETRYGPKY